MIVIERAKSPTACSHYGRMTRTGDQTLCTACHDDVEDRPDHRAGRQTMPLILRS
jgi:5-methylcytosine-specific restriction endonuclease McrA